jgi:hypothetical protein
VSLPLLAYKPNTHILSNANVRFFCGGVAVGKKVMRIPVTECCTDQMPMILFRPGCI